MTRCTLHGIVLQWRKMSITTAMAFTRQEWIKKFRNRLEGAIGEYAKIKMAQSFDLPCKMWEEETKKLMHKVSELLIKDKIKTKAAFSRYKAAAEAFLEAASAQEQVVKSKNKFLDEYLSNKKFVGDKVIDHYTFEEKTSGIDSEDLALELIEKHLKDHYKGIIKEIEYILSLASKSCTTPAS